MKEKQVLNVKYRLKKIPNKKKFGRQAEESAINIIHRYSTKQSRDFMY